MSDRYTLRAATNDDRSSVIALVPSTLQEFGLAYDATGTDADLCELEGSYAGRGGAFSVLVDEEDHVVGCVGLYAVSAETCELRKMYLRSQLRGQGLGRRLLEHALAQARALGFRRVVLETASVLTDAIALYVAYGFRPFDAEHLSCRCNQAYLLELHETQP